MVAVRLLFLKAPAEIGVQDDFCRCMEDLRQRDAEGAQKMHQRSVVLVELRIDGLGLRHGRFQDEAEDSSLLVAEERPQRVGGRSKFPVQESNDLWEIRTAERLGQHLRHSVIALWISNRP